MAARRQPDMAFGATDNPGDNLFNKRQMSSMSMAMPGQAPGAGQPMNQPQAQPQPQAPQLPQVPIVAPPLKANTSMAAPSGGQGMDINGPNGPIARQPDVQRRQYNTDGYAQPNKVAAGGTGPLAGWDPQKWANADHQTPKYVSGRFMAEAGDQKDPANRQKYLDSMKEAYGADNFRFNGKDKISIDGGKSFVDVWGSAGAGLYIPAWQDESSQGGGGLQDKLPMDQGNKPVLRSPTGTSADPFTAAGRPGEGSGAGAFTQLPNGDWVPSDMVNPKPSNPRPSGGPVGGDAPPGGAPDVAPRQPGGGMPDPNQPPNGAGEGGSIQDLLKKMMSGDMNKDILNRRVDSARDVLNKQRSSAVDTLGASLAERGQLGSGAGDNAAVRLDQGLNDDFAMTVNDIYANEGENADKRLMAALGIGGEMETADKDRVVDTYNAETGRLNSDRDYDLGNKDIDVRRRSVDNDYDIGIKRNTTDNRRIDSDERLGNRRIDVDERLGSRGLDLTERGQNIDWDKFSSQFGLDSEDLQNRIRQGDTQSILDLLRIMGGNAGTASGGFF